MNLAYWNPNEIARWNSMPDPEKADLLLAILERIADHQMLPGKTSPLKPTLKVVK